MTATDEQVRAALVEFIAKHIAVCFVGVVSDISKAESEAIVTVKYNDLDFEARLQAVTGKGVGGFVPVPAVGSEVFCVSEGNSDNSFVVASFSELKKIIINGGELGGLVKLQELQDNLNSLKQYMEAINSALPGAFNAIGASTAANGASGGANYQGAMAGKAIQFKDMEDKKVLH
jgi:prolyl-tRNA editing enzyme YbaK/EbsC (Cys-tRNA(Pro) deacylase)